MIIFYCTLSWLVGLLTMYFRLKCILQCAKSGHRELILGKWVFIELEDTFYDKWQLKTSKKG